MAARLSSRATLTGAAVLLVLLAAAGGLVRRWYGGRDRPSGSLPEETPHGVAYIPPDNRGYVGSEACAACHAEICEQYAAHPMAQSTRRIDELKIVESFDEDVNHFVAFGRYYEASREGDRWVHSEELRSDSGELLFRQRETLAYAIGAGLKGRSYLIDRDGWLYESPITWYSEKARWQLSPGYDYAGHSRFDRIVNDGCLFCHSSQVRFTSRSNRRLQTPRFAEVTIGCERCHGPGREHVEVMERAERDGVEVDGYRIVNPEQLTPALRDSVCYQCHLEGKARILRNGRAFFDFRPGQDVEEVWTVFVADEEESLFTGQPEQMISSVCYQESEGRMGCTSCHDPHWKPDAQARVAFYRSRCLQCHPQQACTASPTLRRVKEDSCIECHMPRLPTDDVAHATVSDHRIPRRPRVETNRRRSAPRTWRRFSDYRLPDAELRRAWALARFQQASEFSDIELAERARRELEALAASGEADFTVYSTLANLYLLQKDYERSRKWAEAALRLKPEHCQTLALLGLVCYRSDADEASLEYYRRLFEINPNYVLAAGPYADLLRLHGHTEEALKVARRGVALNPTDGMLRAVLADALTVSGQSEEARRQTRLRQRIESQLRRAHGR